MISLTDTISLAQSDLSAGVRYFLEQIINRPWVTAIELLMIGSIIYAILRSLEGTRGARLIRALLMILGVSFAAVWLITERFEFDRINALYPYFILAVFLVSLVAFQTELRRLLLQLGEGFWLRRWLGSDEHLVDPIVIAVERLAKKKIGALIALERTSETRAIAETGVQLDAVVTSELIETIFWPGSALHDLGMVVSQDRIRAAGCQFPLAESDTVDRSLGSRHRAAVGMSEETDAVVIIVSEETGGISVALQGRLRRGLTPGTLRELLISELGVVVEETEPEPEATDEVQDSASSDGTSKVAAELDVPAMVGEEAKSGAGQAA